MTFAADKALYNGLIIINQSNQVDVSVMFQASIQIIFKKFRTKEWDTCHKLEDMFATEKV